MKKFVVVYNGYNYSEEGNDTVLLNVNHIISIAKKYTQTHLKTVVYVQGRIEYYSPLTIEEWSDLFVLKGLM